jgi:Asp/Glu/hydantoin racemase
VTCSAFGPAIDALAATLNIPVLKPNDAMFEASISRGNRIGMLATFEPSISTMNDEFEEQARRMGIAATLETVLVRDALDFLKGGDAASHNRLLAAQAPKLAHCDAIMLAHFSTSRALEMVQQEVDAPIFTAPHAAVTRMRALVERNGSQVHL